MELGSHIPVFTRSCGLTQPLRELAAQQQGPRDAGLLSPPPPAPGEHRGVTCAQDPGQPERLEPAVNTMTRQTDNKHQQMALIL